MRQTIAEEEAVKMSTKEMYDPLTDPDYQDHYIDVEEERERILPDGRRIPYHYIHGGFASQSVKFILCMPEKDIFKGRFFQYLAEGEFFSILHVVFLAVLIVMILIRRSKLRKYKAMR